MIKTVGDLRRALEDVPDELEILVRASSEEDDGDVFIICGLKSASVDTGCSDEPFFALDANDDPEESNLRLVN